jgi:hypothetical protein
MRTARAFNVIGMSQSDHSLDPDRKPRSSIRLDVSGLDDLAPLLGFVGDQLGEVGRRAG